MDISINNRFNIISAEAIKWCIYAIVFAAPFSKSISEAAIILAIVFWLVEKIINGNYAIIKTGLNTAFMILAISIALSLLNAYRTLGSADFFHLSVKAFFTKALKYFFLYFIIVDKLDTKNKLKDLLSVVLMSVIIVLIDGFGQYYYTGVDGLHGYPSFKTRDFWDGIGPFRGFPTACFPFPNDFAAWMLLTVLPLTCVAFFDLRRNRYRYLAWITAAAGFYMFFLTKARGAWLGLAVSAGYIALSKKMIWFIFILVLLVAVPFILKMEMAHYIFETGSMGDRFGMWGTSMEIFKKHPVIGNGLNTYFVNFKEHRNDEWKGKKGSYAHNCYLQMACDIGVLGLGAFLWLMYSYFLSVVKALKKIKDQFFNSVLWGISIGVFAFLVHSFFDTNLYSLNLVTLFWCAIGISQAIINVCGKESNAAA
jgi:O-antigen ligase